MHIKYSAKLFGWLLGALLLLASAAPAIAYAAESSRAATTVLAAEGDGETVTAGTQLQGGEGDIASGITLGLLFLVLAVVMGVVIVAAVSLGIIGIGYSLSQPTE